jgi:hypothetical protein
MEIVKDESIPRKWEWVAKQLKQYPRSEAVVQIAERIDDLMKTIYGENTHTQVWVEDMRVWKKDRAIITIMDLATKGKNCTACAFSKDCTQCEFGKSGGICQSRYHDWTNNPPDPLPLFKQFLDQMYDYKYSESR